MNKKIYKQTVEITPEDSAFEKITGKVKNPDFEWYTGNLLKKVFIVRLFGFELSLYREVKNVK